MGSEAQLLEAVKALYHHTDPKVKEAANKWLEDWQQTTEAWQISDRVLHNLSAPMEAHYFCAQTLRTKVQRDFEELPDGAAGGLRDSVMVLLVRFCRGAPPVRTQLCLALAALAAHLPGQHWGQGGVVQWLTQRLSSQPPDVALPCMLELLTVLPQEGGSYRPAVRPERRRQMTDELIAATPSALSVLTGCLQQHGERTRSQVLEAFGAWLKLSNGNGLDGAVLASHPLVAASVEGLAQQETFDAAVDAVVELVYCTASNGEPDARWMPLVQVLVPSVMSLRPRFLVLSQRAHAAAEGKEGDTEDYDDDEDVGKGIARLFAEIGEAYAAILAAGAAEGLAVVEALLEAAAHPDDTICAMTFNFWHRLSHILTSNIQPQPIKGANGVAPPPAEEQDRRIALFTPAYERLVNLIRGRVRYPDDFDRWHRDEAYDFKRARYAIGDTLLDAAAVLGGPQTLGILVEPLVAQGQRVAAQQDFDWRTAEAALYCIRAVHRVAPPPGDGLLLTLFASLPSLPAQAQLQYTAALTTAAYNDWLAASLRNGAAPDLLPRLLQMLTQSLGSKEASGAAALALRHLCGACAQQLAPCLEALMQLYQRVQGAGIARTGAAAAHQQQQQSSDLAMDEDDVGQVIEAVALVVAALPGEQQRQGLAALLGPVTTPLQQLLQQQPLPPGALHADAAHARLDLLLALFDRLTVILKTMREPGAVVEALQGVWPLVEAALRAHGSDDHAAEQLCRVPRYALRTAGKAAAPLVPALLAALPQWFAASRNPSYLYVASELIKIFGDEPAHDADLGALLARMLGDACSGLASLRAFEAAPDVADDVFLLAGRALSYCHRIVLTPHLLPVLLDTAATGLLVQHREACCSILAFLARLLDPKFLAKVPPEVAAQLQGAFLPRGGRLVRLLLAGLAGALPASRSTDLADVLFVLLQVTAEQGVHWVADAVKAIPDTAMTQSDERKLMEMVSKVANHAQLAAQGQPTASAGELEDALDEFSELCRRNKRSREAAQHALLPPDILQQLQF